MCFAALYVSLGGVGVRDQGCGLSTQGIGFRGLSLRLGLAVAEDRDLNVESPYSLELAREVYFSITVWSLYGDKVSSYPDHYIRNTSGLRV